MALVFYTVGSEEVAWEGSHHHHTYMTPTYKEHDNTNTYMQSIATYMITPYT